MFVLGTETESAPVMKPSDLEAAVQSTWIFSLIWTLGGSLDESGRHEFDEQFRLFLVEKYDERVSMVIVREGTKLLKPMPKDGLVFNYVYVVSSNSWKEWLDTVPKQSLHDSMEMQNITVVTEDVVRYTHLIDRYSKNHNPVLLVGPTGTGKSAYIKDYLRKLDRDKWVVAVFQFSAQTSQNMTQDIIDGKLDKRRKGVFGPPMGKHQICLVDDLNMPQVIRPTILRILQLWCTCENVLQACVHRSCTVCTTYEKDDAVEKLAGSHVVHMLLFDEPSSFFVYCQGSELRVCRWKSMERSRRLSYCDNIWTTVAGVSVLQIVNLGAYTR